MSNYEKKDYPIEKTATSIYFAIKDVVKELQQLNTLFAELTVQLKKSGDDNHDIF